MHHRTLAGSLMTTSRLQRAFTEVRHPVPDKGPQGLFHRDATKTEARQDAIHSSMKISRGVDQRAIQIKTNENRLAVPRLCVIKDPSPSLMA